MSQFQTKYVRFSFPDIEKRQQIFSHTVCALASAVNGAVFLDFYLTKSDIPLLPSGSFVDTEQAPNKGLLSRVFQVESISVYACVPIASEKDIFSIENKFLYSTPKLFRILQGVEDIQRAALLTSKTNTIQTDPPIEFCSSEQNTIFACKNAFHTAEIEIAFRIDVEGIIRSLLPIECSLVD